MACFTLPGYARLYRSVLRFVALSPTEAKGLLYLRNTANTDTCMYRLPQNRVAESSQRYFSRYLYKPCRPYRTEMQLYKALYCLYRKINNRCITNDQRQAVARLRRIMDNPYFRFYKTFGMDIDDKCTVYPECAYSLILANNEPGVCLHKDWAGLVMS